MTAGDCSPAVPTDPDVPDSGIRLLGLWRRHATINTVNHTRRWEGIALEQTIELTQTEHDNFNRFLLGFTTAAGTSDTQSAEVRDFFLDFRLPGDTPLGADGDWP